MCRTACAALSCDHFSLHERYCVCNSSLLLKTDDAHCVMPAVVHAATLSRDQVGMGKYMVHILQSI